MKQCDGDKEKSYAKMGLLLQRLSGSESNKLESTGLDFINVHRNY